MEALKLLQTRRSCRSYKKEMISDQELNEILQAGLNAPSAKNEQNTKIVVIKNPELIQELAKINASFLGVDTNPFYNAPVICLILAKKDGINKLQDGASVLVTMQYAAYSLNIGSCYINRTIEMMNTTRDQELLKEWGMEEYQGVGTCILGYPDKPLPPKKIKEDRIKIID
jgi:nitroreductase